MSTPDLVAAFEALGASAPPVEGAPAAIDALCHALASPPAIDPGRAPLPDALADAVRTHGVDRNGVAAALAALADELAWLIPYGDHDEPDMRHLHANYRYAALVGPYPEARHHDDRAALFATVQGPEVHYAQHVHKAPELYVVIGGSGDWQIGDGPFEPKRPGDWIWHPTGTRHAMRTGSEPMTALAVWTADLDSHPVIVRH